MNPTFFLEIVESFFRLVVGKITEKINGKKTETPLLHKTLLTEEYSADLTWGATELNTSVVAADVVSLDSSLPLKRRDRISAATGTIPKLGIKYQKGEKAITDINIMRARGADEDTVVRKIFDDVPKAIKAVDVRVEIMFLQGLSTGETLVPDEERPGTGVRVSFGYKPENTFHALKGKWGEAAATPQDDLQQLFDRADEDGNSIERVFISKKYFDYFRKSEQGRILAANYLNQPVLDKAVLPVVSRTTMLDALQNEYGAQFQIVNSTFKVEDVAGNRKSIVPYAEANIVGVPSADSVGRIVYGTLAEETNPVEGVSYQKSGSYTLVSKYSKNDPLREFTTSQALVLPVIDGADGIYILHADQTGDTGLSVEPKTLSLGKDAGSGTFTFHYDGSLSDIELKSSQTWATATRRKNVVTVSVEQNAGEAREAKITVSGIDGLSAEVTVNQAAGTE